jgi:hypothetical protein
VPPDPEVADVPSRGERLLWLLRHLHREFNIIDQSRRKSAFRKPPAPGMAP